MNFRLQRYFDTDWRVYRFGIGVNTDPYWIANTGREIFEVMFWFGPWEYRIIYVQL